MNANMNAIRTMLVAAALVLAPSAHAQECSGGTDGGMDATGNQCSLFNPVAANTAATKVSSPARNTAMARNGATASPVARPEGAVSRARSVVAAKPAAAPAKGPEAVAVVPRMVKVNNTAGAN